MDISELKFVKLLLLSALACTGGCSDNAQETVYTNGFVYTVNPDRPTAEALAVRDGMIIAVGGNEDVQAQVSDRARVVDLEGRMLMPGIHDMHAHPMEAGEKYNFQCAFPFTFTVDQIVAKLTECAAETPPGEWIRGGQWAMELMETRSRTRTSSMRSPAIIPFTWGIRPCTPPCWMPSKRRARPTATRA